MREIRKDFMKKFGIVVYMATQGMTYRDRTHELMEEHVELGFHAKSFRNFPLCHSEL